MFGRKSKAIADLETENSTLKAEIEGFHNLSLSEMESWSDLLTGLKTGKSGQVVNAVTAMKSSTVYRCVAVLSGFIGALPVDIFKAGDVREKKNDHPLGKLLRVEPEPATSAVLFWETVIRYILLAGNAYAIIHRVGSRPVWIEFLYSGISSVKKDKDTGRLTYFVARGSGVLKAYDQDDMLHFSSFEWNGMQGTSALQSGGFSSIGISLAADDHSASVLSNGGLQQLAVEYPKRMTKDQMGDLREFLVKSGSSHSDAPRIITEDGKIKSLGLSSKDLQLIETRQYNVSDQCRVFGVPPILAGESEKNSSWGTGIEEIIRGFVRFTCRPHITRIEQELNRKLFPRTPFFAEFNMEGALRGDTKTRHEAYKIARGGNQEPGYMKINEIRAKENLPPDPDGDRLYIPPTGAPPSEE